MKNNNQAINSNTHVSRLEYRIQNVIKHQLYSCGCDKETVDLLMSSRLRDLPEEINMEEVLA